MEKATELAQLRRIATEAIGLLEDVKHKFGLFEAQRLGKIKGKFANYNNLPDPLSHTLSAIKTSDESGNNI
jgi:hypothetical protein